MKTLAEDRIVTTSIPVNNLTHKQQEDIRFELEQYLKYMQYRAIEWKDKRLYIYMTTRYLDVKMSTICNEEPQVTKIRPHFMVASINCLEFDAYSTGKGYQQQNRANSSEYKNTVAAKNMFIAVEIFCCKHGIRMRDLLETVTP